MQLAGKGVFGPPKDLAGAIAVLDGIGVGAKASDVSYDAARTRFAPIPLENTVKTMTCKELGGTCDKKLSAASWEQMVQAMTKHVMEAHPDVAKKMEAMHKEDPKKRGKEMKPKWDAKSEG
jgi:hypothetical protein